MVAEEAALLSALHPYPCFLAQPGGALVRIANTKANQARLTQKRPGTGSRNPGVHRCPQSATPTLSLDKIRRPDPGLHRSLRHRHSRRSLSPFFYEKSMTQETRIYLINRLQSVCSLSAYSGLPVNRSQRRIWQGLGERLCTIQFAHVPPNDYWDHCDRGSGKSWIVLDSGYHQDGR